MKQTKFRDGVKTIEQLKPYKFYGKDNQIRYCFHQMVGIFENTMNFDSRHCTDEMIKLGFNIPTETKYCGVKSRIEYAFCDFWLYQLEAIFRKEVRNGQCNTIYVGTPEKLDLKKLKKEPNEWQLFMLEKWRELFSHLADKNGYIKVEVWW